jgi:hypothetical protein
MLRWPVCAALVLRVPRSPPELFCWCGTRLALDTEPVGHAAQVIVEREAAVAGTAEVLAAQSIPAAMSADLRAVLGAWPPGAAA